MNDNIVLDKIETLILMSLDAKKATKVAEIDAGIFGRQTRDQGDLLNFGEMSPSSAFTIDIRDENRIFTDSPELLLDHPAEIIGDSAEIVLLDGDVLRWRGYRKLKKPPRGVCCIGKPSHWFEAHLRDVTASGVAEYSKRIVAINKAGNPLPTKVYGHWGCSPIFEGSHLIMCSSIIEDAHRANTFLVSIKDETEIKFPVPIGDYKEVFSGREGPMSGSRKKAIIHWVSKHLRMSKQGGMHDVKKHTRGIHEFTIDGLSIRLTPNDWISS